MPESDLNTDAGFFFQRHICYEDGLAIAALSLQWPLFEPDLLKISTHVEHNRLYDRPGA